jgi:hypothetical protein
MNNYISCTVTEKECWSIARQWQKPCGSQKLRVVTYRRELNSLPLRFYPLCWNQLIAKKDFSGEKVSKSHK